MYGCRVTRGNLRLLLLADTHLGLPGFFSRFERALEPAFRGEVDLVVHGGDVFFRSQVKPTLVLRAFEPLKRLKLRPETELCLGLVHFTDGLEGTRRRIAAARKYAEDFSIATECGFGRRKVETIPELLRIHAAAAEL